MVGPESEIEQCRRELEQSEARFRDVIERNADAVVVVDRSGIVRFANRMASELFGIPRDTLIGRSFGHPLVAGETTELDLPRAGAPRVVEMRVVESAWEGAAACLASLRDITERKQSEEAQRRLIREKAARSAAEAASRRFRFLAESSHALAASLDFDSTLATLVRLCVTEIADWAVIYLPHEEGVVRAAVAHRHADEADAARAWRELPLASRGPRCVLDVLESRNPQLECSVDAARLEQLAESRAHLTLLRTLDPTSFMTVPLVARDQAIGALALASRDGARGFDQSDLELASDLALRAALALDNARLYRAAHDANRAKSDFLALISHDLRTPLNSIIGHADLLTLGIPDPLTEASRTHVDRIRIGAAHLLRLIDELIAYVRLEANREQLERVELDAVPIAAEVCALLEPLAAERGLRLQLHVPPEPVVLLTDPDKLRQILVNLVANAIKYTEQGGIDLDLAVAGDAAVFSVRDTGIGIAREDLPRIFEPFWQADSGARGRDGGTGLGLSLVKRMTQLLDGEITVRSEVGGGSTFQLRLRGAHASAVRLGPPDGDGRRHERTARA